MSKLIQGTGKATGATGGPVGMLIGEMAELLTGRFLKMILVAGAFILFFFLGCVIQSWCPVVFNHVLMIQNESRSEVIKNKNTGIGQSVANFSELKGVMRYLENEVTAVSENLTESERDAVEKAVKEPWDTAYLCAAYGVYTEMYQNEVKERSPEADLILKAGEFLKNAILGYEVEVMEEMIQPAVYPVFEKKLLWCVEADGRVQKKEVYFKIGEEKTMVNREEPVYEPVVVQIKENGEKEGGEIVSRVGYIRSEYERCIYKPEVKTVKEKKRIYGGLKKSAILISLGLKPEALYSCEKKYVHVTNAEYAEYLRKALLETVGTREVKGMSGTYIWPCPGYLEITSPFGYRSPEETDYVGTMDHGGIDIGAPSGAEVVAVASGTVVQAGSNGAYGNCVEIDHGQSMVTLYAHLSEITVRAGEVIKQGMMLGRVGSTGNSTGPHLHFSVYDNGQAFDPMQLFTKSQHPDGLAPEIVNGVSGNVESWRPAVELALKANGLSADEAMIAKVLRQIATESGGNEKIVQQINDINSGQRIPFNGGVCPWCRHAGGCQNTNIGHGLMQTIPSTFNAYCHAGHEDIFNGYDNLLAALNYAKTRYGPSLSGLGEGSGY